MRQPRRSGTYPSPSPSIDGAQLSLLDGETDASLMHRIRSLPKVDLHRHLTGSITAAAAAQLAAKYDVPLPSYISADLDRLLFSDQPETHQQYFHPWSILNKLFVSLDAVRDVLFTVVEAARQDNVVYTELRLGPRGFLGDRSPYNFDDFAAVVADTLDDCDTRFGTVTRCILGIPRHTFVNIPFKLRNKMFARILQTVHSFSNCFVGVDLNGDELAADAAEFSTFFKMAHEIGLPATVHAGELGPVENVAYAASHLFASRIGHGIAAARSPDLLAVLSKKNVVLEICPTSNQLLGLVQRVRELPLPQLRAHAVPFVICTDNPARCRTTLSEELYKVAKAFSYSYPDVVELVRRSATASFIKGREKDSLLERLPIAQQT